MRDLNSCIAKAVPRHTPEYDGGRFWGRRYSAEFLPGDEDLENYFFYTVLQPVQDGLVERISEYPGYNCFHDAVYGIKRKYKVIRWKEFNDARRRNPSAKLKDFTDIVTLEYERLPGYEDLTQQEYAKIMHQKLEERRLAIVEMRRTKGVGFVGRTKLLQAPRGKKPRNTKTSDRYTHRARILSSCPIRRKECKQWYFTIYSDYKEASYQYRNGNLLVEFPPGTYKPPLPPDTPSAY
ncbi:MAG: hypothetical protein J5J00_10330 [Deltaproteobacteria bacterium]|nr:hypothetical protein [Deltaproteobacteria bacterium]